MLSSTHVYIYVVHAICSHYSAYMLSLNEKHIACTFNEV